MPDRLVEWNTEGLALEAPEPRAKALGLEWSGIRKILLTHMHPEPLWASRNDYWV